MVDLPPPLGDTNMIILPRLGFKNAVFKKDYIKIFLFD